MIPRLTLAVLVATLLAGCGDDRPAPDRPRATAPRGSHSSSPAFAPGGSIPTRFTCSGQGSAPPLRWSARPAAPASWCW